MKLTTATRGSRHQRRAGLFAEALDDVEHPGREAGLMGDAAEDPGRDRGVLGGLQDGRVAAHQRREDLPGDVGDRRVGGDDEAGDPSGWRTVIAVLFGTALVVVRP